MIERKFVAQKLKEKQIQEYIASQLARAGHSKIEIRRTPMGERVIVYTSRPGLIVGKKGENITRLTEVLKTKFKMENPQIEIGEIENPFLDPNSVADKIVYTFERFGPKRFKFIGYNTLKIIMEAGAMGAEIVISGRGVPGARAKSWRFSAGHLKKSGDVAESQVRKTNAVANLRSGSIGIKVAIMAPDTKLPDKIEIKPTDIKLEEIKEEEEKKETKPKKKDGNNKEK